MVEQYENLVEEIIQLSFFDHFIFEESDIEEIRKQLTKLISSKKNWRPKKMSEEKDKHKEVKHILDEFLYLETDISKVKGLRKIKDYILSIEKEEQEDKITFCPLCLIDNPPIKDHGNGNGIECLNCNEYLDEYLDEGENNE